MSRQTKTFLKDRFREMGIAPATRHGQNFLIDLNIHRLIVDAADLGPQDVVLEVGTGTGALTALVAERAAAVVTVEIDAHLFELASEQLIELPNVTMLRPDALRNKNHFDDRVADAVGERLAEVGEPAGPPARPGSRTTRLAGCPPPARPGSDQRYASVPATRLAGRRLKLVANLPYNIATPVISNLLLWPHVPHSMVVTIQRELADRITARPFTKDYGALSVWIQSQCTAELVRALPPSVFWPVPKVSSAVIRLVVDRERRAAIGDLAYFHQFIRALFFHRRKFLRANVQSAMKRHLGRGQVDQLLDEMGFAPDTRTEQLDVDTLLAFTDKVRAVAPEWQL